MIQDIDPHQYKNEYKPVPPQKDSILLCYEGKKVLVKEIQGEISFPTFQEMEAYCYQDDLYKNNTYLFTIDNIHFYLGQNIPHKEYGEFQWKNITIFRHAFPKYLSFAGITGEQLYRWYESHQYCGHCGTPMLKDKKERMMYCPKCGLMEYPKICPATIIGVIHDNKLLMTKYAGSRNDHYALVAGFSEIGETIEETVKREVMEEVGLKVRNLTYYKSQPWSFSDTLLFGFFCELDGDIEDIQLDKNELSVALWIEREDIQEELDDISLTNEMIIAFKEKGRNVF